MNAQFYKPQIRKSWAVPSLLVLIGFGQLFCGAARGAAADQYWPQWRGPFGTGAAPSANPPTTWSETSNVRWKTKIPGTGSATPIVWDNYVFVQTAIATGKKVETPGPAPDPAAASQPPPRRGRGGMMGGEKPTEVYQFALLCLDRQTGKVLWQKIAREEVPHEGFRPNEGSFASQSPVTDGKHVYAYFGSRGLYCYDMTGKLEWSKDFGQMRISMGFGEGSSPTLYGDALVVIWDHEGDSFITALDKNTGKELWKMPRDEKTTWATPLVVEVDGKPQVITDATRKIRSYDLATGKLIWECGGLTRNVIPSPVAANETLYAMSGFQGNALLAIRLRGRTGDLTGTDAIVWSHNKNTSYAPSPLLYGDKLYFFGNNNGILSCLDAKSGQALIDAERIEAIPNVYASPVGAGGRVYLAGRNGAVVVLKQSDKLEVLATNQLDEKFDASPAVVGREIFLRGHDYLYCIAEKQSAQAMASSPIR